MAAFAIQNEIRNGPAREFAAQHDAGAAWQRQETGQKRRHKSKFPLAKPEEIQAMHRMADIAKFLPTRRE